MEYVDAIQEDIRWLGYDWGPHLYFASDYFEQLYQWAEELIRRGLAYVDDLSADEIRRYRGTLTEPGRNSPYRDRSVEENLDLFRRMRAGEFPDGARVLRAKIDMASPNMNLRDPTLYRIRHVAHHRTGDRWCIYPMYDYAHPLSDSIERVTHSLCSLEYEDHRPLYDWLCEALEIYHPQQIEFARLNLGLHGHEQAASAPAGPGGARARAGTTRGCRPSPACAAAAYTPEAIRDFCERIGVAKANSLVDLALLDHCVREDLNRRAPRVMAVLRPVRLVIENYPEGQVEELEAVNNPEDPAMGVRKVPFSRVLWIERDDVREVPPPKYFRLFPGNEVRLRYAYIVRCTGVVKDERTGEIVEVRCTYDPASRGGHAGEGRRVKGTIHWVSAAHAVNAEARLYDRLFTEPSPGDESDDRDFTASLNPASMEVVADARVEPGLAGAPPGSRFQFERLGYFCVDPDTTADHLVVNRTVGLRDSWAKIEKVPGA